MQWLFFQKVAHQSWCTADMQRQEIKTGRRKVRRISTLRRIYLRTGWPSKQVRLLAEWTERRPDYAAFSFCYGQWLACSRLSHAWICGAFGSPVIRPAPVTDGLQDWPRSTRFEMHAFVPGRILFTRVLSLFLLPAGLLLMIGNYYYNRALTCRM
jgi:hypothetical protein